MSRLRDNVYSSEDREVSYQRGFRDGIAKGQEDAERAFIAASCPACREGHEPKRIAESMWEHHRGEMTMSCGASLLHELRRSRVGEN